MPRRFGSGEPEPIFASVSRGSPGLTPPQSRRDVRHRAVLEPQFGLKTELDFLGFVQCLAFVVEAEVGRDEIADLGSAFKLGHHLRIAFKEPDQLALDVGVGDGLDRPLDLQALVIRQGEVGPDFDVHLELASDLPRATRSRPCRASAA